jgi:hypothetical protein
LNRVDRWIGEATSGLAGECLTMGRWMMSLSSPGGDQAKSPDSSLWVERSRMRIVWIILLFLTADLFLAAILSCNGMPWEKIIVLVPWLSILAILILAFVEGADKAKWFKAPSELAKFQNAIWARGTPPKEDDPTFKACADRIVAYADRLVDRQINKARGILPFNSLIMTVFIFERSHMSVSLPEESWAYESLFLYWMPTSAFIVILLILGTSSWLCLDLFFVHWRKENQYQTFRQEAEATVRLFNARAINIQWAIVLSEASLFVGLCLVFMTEAHNFFHP